MGKTLGKVSTPSGNPQEDEEIVPEIVDDGSESDVPSEDDGMKRKQVTYDSPEDEDMGHEEDEASVNSDMVVKDTEQESRVTSSTRYITEFNFTGSALNLIMEFPADTKKILMVPLIESVCNKLVINQIPYISRAYIVPSESEADKVISVGTDGCNIKGMWDFENIIDVNKIYTNDIAAILRTYGVEACRASIMQEVASVFAVYGIEVDLRHLSLIADYMVICGLLYRPLKEDSGRLIGWAWILILLHLGKCPLKPLLLF